MKRFNAVKLLRREKKTEFREPTILDHGDPVTVRLTRELEERKRHLNLSAAHPAGL